MSRSKAALLSAAIMLFSGVASAEEIACLDSLQIDNKPHRLNDVSLFQGLPKNPGELMPDTQDKTEWTLKDYQDYAREKNMPLYLVCHYTGTEKTLVLKVPETAKKCSAWYGYSKEEFYASCE
ncbi:STY0301 family protein [Kosakonia sp.]|uniref:STY0301 family protein n=1 Tax=Kosakonia sp. TaxID=1916651 RepID=UPI002897848D|nr:STY0301 family protein [Kosakonia sp.]